MNTARDWGVLARSAGLLLLVGCQGAASAPPRLAVNQHGLKERLTFAMGQQEPLGKQEQPAQQAPPAQPERQVDELAHAAGAPDETDAVEKTAAKEQE